MANPTMSPDSVLSRATVGAGYRPEDFFIAVMGVTGSGKSTFISRVTGGSAKIGHDLVSCTSEIESFSFQYGGSTVHLIDTPGFDDTYRTDSDVLKDIVFWLNAAYRQQVKLSGIVYLHPIDKNRMTGSSYKNIRMFNKLCGDSSLKSVVLGTTMWKHVEAIDGERRTDELEATPNFWGDMVAKGSRIFRHDDSRASAMNIVSYILDQKITTVLQVQRQMVDEGKTLNETSAGRELEKELIKQRELFEKRLRETEEDMKDAMAEGNRKAIEEAAAQQERFQKKLNEALKGSEQLKVSMQKLLEQKDLEHQRAVQNFELERQRSKEESRLAVEKVEELKRQMASRADESEEQRRRHQREIDEMNLQITKQNTQSQASFQEWIAEKMAAERMAADRLAADRLAADQMALERMRLSAMSNQTIDRGSPFGDAFGQSAGQALGQAAGMAAGYGALGAAAVMCTLM